MDTKKFLIASIAGGITLFLLGGLIYGLALKSYVDANSVVPMPDQPVWWSMILSQLVMGGFLAHIYGKWANISTFAGGLKAGVLIGVFLGVGLGFDLASLGLMNIEFASVDVALWAIRFGIAGGVVGQVLGMGENE
jgi:hypothetical protein